MDLIDRDAVISKIKSCITIPADNEWDSGYNTAMAEAKQYIQNAPTVNSWIPCSERLPEVDTNVLIYYPKWEDAPVQTAHITHDGICWEFSDGEFYPSKSEITHWMPLPEIPEPPESEVQE